MLIQTYTKKAIRILRREGFRSLIHKIKRKVQNHNGRLYQLWIEQNESQEFLKELNNTDFEYQPLISIVIPVFNPNLTDLQEAINSVENQIYKNWELCLADASTKGEIKDLLKEKQKNNKNIKVKFLDKNLSIAGNTNEAIKLAKGEFIAFLDHDDTLASFALSEVVIQLNIKPKTDLFYSDEDKISPEGKRFEPHFKPDWSPDLLNSFNYITHFVVARKSLVEELGFLREGFNGAQDYDFLLRITEKTTEITHIPKVLYHWRVGKDSTARDISAKTYAEESGKKALEDKLSRLNITGKVEGTKYACLYRVRYEIKGNPKVSIIIPTKDKLEILSRCVESIIKKTRYKNYEIVIVDNQSQEDETKKYLKKISEQKNIKVISYNKEFNFSALNNYTAERVIGEYLVFLNNDTEVINSEWLESMLEHAQRDEVGAVGAKLYYPDNSIQHSGVILGLGDGFAGHAFALLPREDTGYYTRLVAIQNFVAVTAACIMLRKEIFNEVGGFDEGLQLAFNDVDLCLKIYSKGFRIVWTPYAELYHYESYTRGYDLTESKKAKFIKETKYCEKKWAKYFPNGDPFFNPNLSLKHTEFYVKVNE